MALEDVPYVPHMALMQGAKNRLFVREILIKGTDADPGHFGNAVGRDRARAVPLQNQGDRGKNGFHRLT